MALPTLAVRLPLALASLLAVNGCVSNVETTTSNQADGGGGGGGGGNDGGGGACEVWCQSDKCNEPCTPGETYECPMYPQAPTLICVTVAEGCPGPGKWQGTCFTPLVVSFDGAPVDYLVDSARTFDVSGLSSIITDWPTAKTPWLALDRDGNGQIDDGTELFGSMSPLAGGGRARDGFEALRELDTNGDGRISAADPAFARLVVWADADGDRRSTPRELRPVAELGIVSIDLAYRSEPRCDARGNCEIERSAFSYRDAAGAMRSAEIVDVHLRTQR